MPQEKSDARKMERELKIKFEWREADKNLEKEERNSNVTMRYGSKLLFRGCLGHLHLGPPLRPHRPQRRRQIHLHEGPHRRDRPAEGHRRAPQEDRRPLAGPVRVRRLPRHRHRHHGQQALWAALEEREIIYNKPEMTDEDGSRLGELEGIVGEEDGYEAEANAAVLLQGLDIPDELHERKMSELQGGQKVRVLLAQALFGDPQALLLDEPTNYLDLESIHWLQDFLIRYNGTVITISHDRHFLNSVCTHIADIDYETIITYNGGYDDMVLQKTSIRTRIESQNEQREKKIAQLNDFIARFSAGTRSPGELAQEGSRAAGDQRTGALQHRAAVHPLRHEAAFGQDRPRVRERQQGYSRRTARSSTSSTTSPPSMRGDKVILMGRNGQGKTTLLKALLANGPGVEETDVSIDSGSVKWGHEAQIGYFAQDHKGSIQLGMTRPTGCTSSTRRRPRKTSAASSGRCSSRAKRA
jgi:ATPase subunit of ABC transporter with duplicated ATPase domains